jgi:hypothetical protein
LEQALLSLLSGDAGVRAALGQPPRVFDTAGSRPVLPYLEISGHASEPRDSAGVEASEHRVDLRILSREGGRQEAKEALAAARAVLKAGELEMEGWRCVLLWPVFSDLMVLRPGNVYRAHLRIRAVVEPASG